MDRPRLETVEKNQTSALPVLIFDPKGLIGDSLAERLKDYIFVVLVTSSDKSYDEKSMLKIQYRRNVKIPQSIYTHIFFVAGDKDDRKNLRQFIKEVSKIDTNFVYVTWPDKKKIAEVEKELSNEKIDSRIIVLGDIFSGKIATGGYSDTILEEAKLYRQLYVSSMGLNIIHPVLLEDAVEAILEISLGSTIAKRPYLLYPKQGITVLSFIHILQKIDPLIRVDFENTKRNEVEEEEPEGQHYFPPEYQLEEKIKNAYFLKSQTTTDKIRTFLKPQVSNKPATFIHLAVSTALLIFVLPIFICAFFSLLGFASIKLSLHFASNAQTESLINQANFSASLFKISQTFSKIVLAESSYIGLYNQASYFDSVIDSGELASSLMISGGKAVVAFQSVLQGKSADPKNDSVKAAEELKKALYLYNTLQTGPLAESFKKYKKIADYTNSALSNSVETLPQILGAEGKRKYLILFQNNMELRPGGGFIGSYAILSLDRGKVSDFSIHDVYDADGKLKGHIEPPYPIRRYIPMIHWYLRDSNFDIDFLQNAKNAAFFLKEETDENVDGVLSVDVTFVKYLIDALGSVYVADYSQTVNPDNFYILTQKHSEKNFFPGSTQKKDFLRSLFLAIREKFENTKNLPIGKVLDTLQKSIEEKHFLVAFSDTSIQNAFSAGGFSSSITDSIQNEKKVSDFLGISEANLGTNKANYYVQRKIQEDVTVDKDGNILKKLSLTYFNGSFDWPGGDYKVYIRLILPKNSNLSEINIDGVKQDIVPAVTDFSVYEDKNFTAPKGLEVDQYQEDGKSIFGFLTTVPSQKLQKIGVLYTNPDKIMLPASFYELSLFKQPGVNSYPFDFSLSLPPALTVFQKPEEASLKNNTLYLSKAFQSDGSFRIGIASK